MAVKTVLRYVLAAAIAFGSLAPAYAQQAYFRVTSTTIRGGLENTSPDGITVVLPSADLKMRHAMETELAGPVVYGSEGAGTWTLQSGALPAGTELISDTGVVRGTPESIGTSSGIVLGYEDASGRKGESIPFSISVVPQPELSYQDDLVAQGHRYTQSPDVSDLIGPAGFEIVSGELPSGLVLEESTGILRGTPMQLGVWPGITIGVTDSDGATDVSPSFELEIVEGGVIEYQSPVVVKRGAVVEVTPFVDEMTAPIAFAVADGVTLPEGLSLDEGTGVISGSASAIGLFEGLQVVADDSTGKPAASNLFDVEVVDFSLAYAVEPFQSNTPVSFPPIAVGGTEPLTYSLPEGMLLPPGLLLDAETGVIAGSVADVGIWEDVVVSVTDADGDSIDSEPIDFESLGAMIAYSDAKVAMGEPVGMEPELVQMQGPVAFAMMDGTLPNGVSLDAETGVISGSTDAVGDFPMMVMATDVDEKVVVSEPFMLSVDVPAIGSNSPDARGRVGLPFTYSTGTEGLVAPIQWESLGNPVPPGLVLDEATGLMEGTPVEVGFFGGIELRATDMNGNVVETGVFGIEITEPVLLYADPSTTSVEETSAISPTQVEIAADATYVSAGAPLPDGMSVNPFNGDIEGQPLMDGIWSGISVMVIEPQGWIFSSNEFSIVVGDLAGGDIAIEDYFARVGVAFATDAPTVSSVTGPHAWTVTSGVLPDGLVLDAQTGVISGVPEFAGHWPGIVLRATGADGAASSNAFSITVSALSVSTTDVYYGRVDRPFSAQPLASGATGEVSWELTPTSLPDGINYWSNSGAFEGVPTTEGTYGEFVVKVTDESGAEATSLPFLIVIEPALPPGDILIDVQSIIRARPGVDFGLSPDAEGASGGIAWELVGTLPPGLSFNGATGRIAGQPTAIGLYDGLQLRVTDSTGQTGSSPYFGIDVQQVPSVVVAPDSYSGEVGTAMSIVATHDEQVFGSMEWQLVGRLPFGMRLDPLAGTVSGIPLEPGEFGQLRIKLTDADGAEGLSNAFSIFIASDIEVDLPESGSTPGGGEGVAYTTREGIGFSTPRPGVDGQQGAVQWSLASGTLPPGMGLDPASGRIFGTATTSGTWEDIYLRLEDESSAIVVGPIRIVVLGEIVVSAPATVKGRVGRPLTLTPSAQGLIGSAHWSFQGTGLPLGLQIDSSTGLVSITPTSEADIVDVRFRATDSSDGAFGVSAGTSFVIHPDLVVGAPMVMPATAGLDFHVEAPPTAGVISTARWSVVGSLPQGLSVDPVSGNISGIPLKAGTWPLRLRVTDLVDNAFANSPSFNIVVQAGDTPTEPVPLLVDYASGYTAYTSDPFTTGAPVVVGADGPVTFSVDETSAALPNWASLDPVTGAISGTPPAAGSWSGIFVAATDGVDTMADGPITITARPFEVISPEEAKGRVGTPMSFKATAAVAKGAVAWRVESGSLPAGLSIDAGKGSVSGTPTSAFLPIDLVLRATDSAGRTDISDPISVSVDPIVIVPATYRGAVGTAFATQQPSLVGTTGGVTWSLASGTLPQWASLDPSTGRISGTPDSAGTTIGLSLRGTHSATGLTAASGSFSIEVSLPDLVVGNGPSHVRERMGTPIQFEAPTATGNIGAVAWSIVKGIKPSWMSIDAATGVVSAQSAQAASSGALALRATDATTSIAAETSTFSVTYVADPVATIAANASGMAGKTMSVAPVASNIIGTASWSIQSGTLPSGLTLNVATGAISGTPTSAAVGTHPGISLRVVDGHDGRFATTGMLSIVVSPDLSVTGYQAQHVTHPGLPVSTPLPTLVNATGTATWALASGVLPSGMSLSPSTGGISGTPTQAGVFTVSVRGSDAVSGGSAVSDPIQFRVIDLTAAIAPSFEATVTQTFVAAPSVANAIGSTTWALDAGTLPSWASLNEVTGRISGTPTEEGTHSGLRLRVTDSTGVSTTTGTFAISVVRVFAVAMSPTSYSGRVGVPMTLGTPVAQNAIGSLIWSVQGSLPQGMGLNPSTGVVSGTPSAVGGTTFQLRATDTGDGSIGQTPTISVSVEDVPAITVETLYTGRMNADFLAVPTVVRANGTRTWSVAGGTLPPGLSLSSSGGIISGAATQVGQWDGIVLRLVDGQGASGVSAPFSIRIDPGISASIPTTAYDIRMGNALVMATPIATNVLGSVVWTVDGTLPAGMSLNGSTGVVSGTPAAAGTFSFRLQARDTRDNARAWTQQVTILVHAALTITGGRTSYGTHIDIPLATDAYGVIGARGSVAWSIASGTLPSWASLNAATGVVSGTPTTPDNVAAIALRATDSNDGSSVVGPSFSIVVLDRMLISDMATNYYARVGQPFSSFPPSAAPVGGSVEWYMNAGVLPGWATLNPGTGVMSGTPPSAATTSSLRLGARDDYGADERSVAFNLNVRSAPTMTPSTLQLKRRVGVAGGNITFTSQSLSPNPLWSYDGVLPSGMSFSTANGTISGTVAAGAATGSYNLDVSVQDAVDYYSATEQVQIQVGPQLSVAPTIPDRTVRANAHFSIDPPAHAGVVGDATWLVTGMGPNMAFDRDTGVVSGTANGTTTGYYRLTDSWDGASANSGSYRINVVPGLHVQGIDNVAVLTGAAVNGFTPTLANAQGSVSWALEAGSLPSGISVNATTGRLQGSTTQEGSYGGITLRGTDSWDGAHAVSNSFTLVVGSDVEIVTSSSLAPHTGSYTSITFATVNTSGTLQWSVSGTLPTGYSFTTDAATRTARLYGTIAASSGNVSYPVTISVTDGMSRAGSQEFVITPSPRGAQQINATASGYTFNPISGVSDYTVYLVGGGSGGGHGGGPNSRGGPGQVVVTTVSFNEPVLIRTGQGGNPGQPGGITSIEIKSTGQVLASAQGGQLNGAALSSAQSVPGRSVALGVTGSGSGSTTTSSSGSGCSLSITYRTHGAGGRAGVLVGGSGPTQQAGGSWDGTSGTGYGAGGGGGYNLRTDSYDCYGDVDDTTNYAREGTPGLPGTLVLSWGY